MKYLKDEINEIKITDMKNEITEILNDYMTERQGQSLQRLVNLISVNLRSAFEAGRKFESADLDIYAAREPDFEEWYQKHFR